MSGIAHPHSPVRLRVRSSRLTVFMVAFLVICAAIVGVIVLSSGSSESSSPSVTPVSHRGGPNEAARGQAAASATGSSQPTQTGGPNESLRGNLAASATRP